MVQMRAPAAGSLRLRSILGKIWWHLSSPKIHNKFEHISHRVNRFLGTSQAFLVGLVIMLIWVLSFLFSGKWHELIVELVGMVSFLNLFTLQRAQNKDLKAIHIKLDELIASSSSATNRLIKAEEAPEHVLDQVHELYKNAASASGNGTDPSRASMNIEAVEHVMDALREDIEKAAQLESEMELARDNLESSDKSRTLSG